jgi:2-polyprenyl-3-methyl-5-hydroxy-6-metoxy-1,4-benzoquinol methylase
MRNIDDYQKQYAENYPYEPNQVRYRRESILEIIEELNPARILEIGCGYDPLFRYLDTFEKYVVVDPGKNFIEVAKEFANDHQHREKITIVNEYFKGKTDTISDFDFVICAGLLHELSHQQEFMQQLYEVADENTTVHVNVPNANSFHRLVAVKAGIIESVHEKSEFQKRFQQHNVFTIDQLTELAVSVGFKSVGDGTISFKPFTHNQMQAIIDQKILDKKSIDALAGMVSYCPNLGSEMFVNLKK